MQIILRRLRQRVRIKDITNQEIAACANEIIENQHEFLSTIDAAIINNDYYIKCFLKKLISVIENNPSIQGDYELDEIYSKYISLISVAPIPVDTIENIHYSLLKSITDNTLSDIVIQETPNLINGFGCTGYRTWEASLFICEYLLNHTDIFALFPEMTPNSNIINVLELGAGTGLLSVFFKKTFDFCLNKFYVTDGESVVADRIKDMFLLNETSTENVEFQKLWWGPGGDDIPTNNLILAADVTYDVSLIPMLVYSLQKSLFANFGSLALIASTVRNESTVQLFEKLLHEYQLHFEIVFQDPNPGAMISDDPGKLKYSVFFPKNESEMRIYKIRAGH